MIADPILGPPYDTGSYVFRTLSGLANQNMGYGFAIPAEGYLNFGAVGAFLLPMVAGAVLAWLYSHFSPDGTRAINLVYAVAVGTLLFAWRSDVLGAVKGVLYPAIIIWAVIVFALSRRSTEVAQSELTEKPSGEDLLQLRYDQGPPGLSGREPPRIPDRLSF
jgi:hypothetical protein